MKRAHTEQRQRPPNLLEPDGGAVSRRWPSHLAGTLEPSSQFADDNTKELLDCYSYIIIDMHSVELRAGSCKLLADKTE